MQNKIHCSLDYHQLSVKDFPIFAIGVRTSIYNNPIVFDPTKTPAPPITDAQFAVLISNYETAYAAFKSGGLAQKPAYITAKAALMNGLDETATYADAIANGNAQIIELAGYKATNSTAAEVVKIPEQAKIIKVTNGAISGEIDAECETFGNDHVYGCIASEGHALDASIVISKTGHLVLPANLPNRLFFDLNKSRIKQFSGLTKGVDYYFYFYVVNTAGVGALSVAVVKMSL